MLPKDLECQLTAMLNTVAFRRYADGMTREITYRDAIRFWDLSEIAQGDEVDQTIDKVPVLLVRVEQLLIGETVKLSDGQSVSRADLQSLAAVHRFLVEQFSRNLRLQRECRRF
ncbi:MAG TPA: hypothetical protein VHR66_21900 [Gemmataceae bacterium]|jgi:hypothetical protein|nr:hypothetical protein [Gemmataceae bacterium]